MQYFVALFLPPTLAAYPKKGAFSKTRGGCKLANLVNTLGLKKCNPTPPPPPHPPLKNRISGKLPTYPSSKPTLTLASNLRQKVGLREGWVGSFPETYNDPKKS